MSLGSWALIDIETTGISPAQDQIIDVGYLQFEGTKLQKTYSSLVYTDLKLGQFIQKLTGITPEMVKKAPSWSKVKGDVQELGGHTLLAHNANFERSFLEDTYEELGVEAEVKYADSLLFCALLFPRARSLKLENLIIELGIADVEIHRGFEDSRDLLKVLLMGVALHQTQEPELYHFLKHQMARFDQNEFWYKAFYALSFEQLCEIAAQIDFSLQTFLEKYLENKKKIDQFSKSLIWDDLHFDSQSIQSIFQNEKNLQQLLPNYKYRSSQEKMSLRVGQAFKNDIHALIQAPTGTGKTIGYLIPSLLMAKEEGKQVLLATATKTLQEQAKGKDIPLAKNILGEDFKDLKTTTLMGSKNHFCELLFRQEEDSILDDFETSFIKVYFETLFFYNARVNQEDRLLRMHVPGVLRRLFESFHLKEREIQVDFRSCMGNNCPHKNECSYLQGLREAQKADIILGNHALMFHWPLSLEKPEYIVVDEAHKIENEATSAFTLELGEKEFMRLGAQLAGGQGTGALFYLLSIGEEKGDRDKLERHRREFKIQGESIQERVRGLSTYLDILFKKSRRYTSLYWNELPMISPTQLKDEISAQVLSEMKNLHILLQESIQWLVPYIQRWQQEKTGDEDKLKAIARFESLYSAVEEAYNVLQEILGEDSDYSRSLKFHEDYGFSLEVTPIDIGHHVYKELLEPSRSTVMTSATLVGKSCAGSAGIKWMSGHQYLASEKQFSQVLALEPVFDYKKNAKVYLCTDTPSMYEASFIPHVLEQILPLVMDLGGKTLFLYSSRARFEAAREVLFEKLSGQIAVFSQGLGTQVVDEFMKADSGVLIGMESFGEGIDIPGDALKLVYVDKVPDLRQDQVVQMRRDFYEKSFGNEFADYFMAHRARSLLQKLGRLIRTESDSGVVIVTDSRLAKWKGRTVGKFLELLDPYEPEVIKLEEAVLKAREDLLPFF